MSIDSIQKAKVYTHEGLKMRLALYKDNDNNGLATSLNNYGVVLLMEGDDLEQADHYLTRGLEMRMRLFKGNTSHPDIIQSLGNCERLREIRMRRLFIKQFEKEAKKKQNKLLSNLMKSFSYLKKLIKLIRIFFLVQKHRTHSECTRLGGS